MNSRRMQARQGKYAYQAAQGDRHQELDQEPVEKRATPLLYAGL
jgi:hypothetical protein